MKKDQYLELFLKSATHQYIFFYFFFIGGGREVWLHKASIKKVIIYNINLQYQLRNGGPPYV